MLCDQIALAQSGDKSIMLALIEQFKPLITKYAKLLNTEDAFEEMRLVFIELIMELKLDKLRSHSDGVIVAYITKTIRTRYIAKNKRRELESNTVYWDDLDESLRRKLEPSNPLFSAEEDFIKAIPPGVLNEKELDIIVMIYLYGYTVAEVARTKGITRQAVNQIKLRALIKIQHIYFLDS